MIDLEHGRMRLSLHPDLGAGISAFDIDGQPLFAPAREGALNAGDMFAMSSFPLFPYSNRIGGGRFDWLGEARRVRALFEPGPHALHGVVWQRKWTIAGAGTSRALLTLDHVGDEDWPFAFAAQHELRLTERGLTMTLAVENRAGREVPMGGGFHPYFPARGATLTFAADHGWKSGRGLLPERRVGAAEIADFSDGARVASHELDHCFDGWDGRAHIRWDGARYGLDIEADAPLRSAVVYSPRGEDYFCFEPVSHTNNALNLPGARPMQTLAPGKVWRAEARFHIVAA